MQASELFKQSNTVLLDGGMGTMLQASGLKLGAKPEELNITDPELIESIHAKYAAAGSRIVNALALDSISREGQLGLGPSEAVDLRLGQFPADSDNTVQVLRAAREDIVRDAGFGILRADFAVIDSGNIFESLPAIVTRGDRVGDLPRCAVRVREIRPVCFLCLHKQPAGLGVGLDRHLRVLPNIDAGDELDRLTVRAALGQRNVNVPDGECTDSRFRLACKPGNRPGYGISDHRQCQHCEN